MGQTLSIVTPAPSDGKAFLVRTSVFATGQAYRTYEVSLRQRCVKLGNVNNYASGITDEYHYWLIPAVALDHAPASQNEGM